MTTKGTATTAVECTMCGDHGLPNHLFKCTVCIFRSQHRYCSDLYPKAEAYRVCNWCLRDKEGKAWREEMEGLHVSSPTSNSSHNSNTSIGLKRPLVESGDLQRSCPLLLNPIKKHRSSDSMVDRSGFSSEKINNNNNKQHQQKHYTVVRKPSLVGGCTEFIRRSKSDELANVAKTGLSRPIFRGKARRYKLLEEVSS